MPQKKKSIALASSVVKSLQQHTTDPVIPSGVFYSGRCRVQETDRFLTGKLFTKRKPNFKTPKSLGRSKNMGMVPAGPETEIDCAGERPAAIYPTGQQESDLCVCESLAARK
jgi:hypothetical protein